VLGEFLVFEFPVEFIGNHHWGMRRVVGDVAEEGLIAIGFYEVNRVIGEVVDDVSMATDFAAIVVERRTEVVPPVAGGEAVVFIEASVVRMIGGLGSVVPLSKCSSCVAVVFENIGDGGFVGIESTLSARNAADSCAWIVAAG